MKNEILPLLIFGTGGISKEVTFLIEEVNHIKKGYEILGFIERDDSDIGKNIMGYSVVTSDSLLRNYVKKYDNIGIILPIGNPNIKKKIYERLLKNLKNICYPNIIHPNTTIDMKRCDMGVGNIVTSGVRLTTDIKIGNFNLFNLNVTVGHDCNIGDFCVINPLTSISGRVTLEGGNLVGTGVNILENLKIGKGTTLGAGCVVTKDWGSGHTLVGIPAKDISKIE